MYYSEIYRRGRKGNDMPIGTLDWDGEQHSSTHESYLLAGRLAPTPMSVSKMPGNFHYLLMPFILEWFLHVMCVKTQDLYVARKLEFLTDEQDTVEFYEQKGKSEGGKRPSQNDQLMAALSSLDRVQQVEAITGMSFCFYSCFPSFCLLETCFYRISELLCWIERILEEVCWQ